MRSSLNVKIYINALLRVVKARTENPYSGSVSKIMVHLLLYGLQWRRVMRIDEL